VSRALSASTALRSLAGTFANASSVGAKTVSASAPFRVSTRPASVTAVTSVLSSGLALAADATGAVDMPSKLPAPVVGTDAQPAPNVCAPASVEASLGVIDSLGEAGVGSSASDAFAPFPPQAARVSDRARREPAAAVRRRVCSRMVNPFRLRA
jgi:hypothetical protein